MIATAGRRAMDEVLAARSMMGGRVHVALRDDLGRQDMAWRTSDGADATRAAEHVLDRIDGWARRLTRFDPASELCRLNDAPGSSVTVGPTLATVLDWARVAEGLTDGLVDVSMLDARLAAEHGSSEPAAALFDGARRRWSMTRLPHGAIVHREPGIRFDLDGIAKGWIADRALAITPGGSAMVDGDGDVAIRLAAGQAWAFGIADPRDEEAQLGVIELRAPDDRSATFGLVTSGTSVHRWTHGFGATHHLIDPRTRRPAVTDVVQATVLATTARAAEAFAKVAVVAGSDAAFDRLARSDVLGLLLLTDTGEVRASQGMLRWLA